MTEQTTHQSADYAQVIAKLVTKMPVEQAAQVYEFVRFLRSRPVHSQPVLAEDEDDWLDDDEAQMQAEDALWEDVYTRHRDKFEALAEAARAEIATKTTQPMFDEQGNFVADELTHDP